MLVADESANRAHVQGQWEDLDVVNGSMSRRHG